MPVVLHLSDLHRTDHPKIDNATLLASLKTDSRRWALGGIEQPDLAIVSGDLVQGVRADNPDFEAELTSQYEEAGEFLNSLARWLFAGDRGRIVIVPGNHDVCWPLAKASMRDVPAPENIGRKSQQPNSGQRWDWARQQTMEIVDNALYESRLRFFRDFRRDFYSDVTPDPLKNHPDLLHLEYPDLGLLIVGLSSWYGNDCYCTVGDIEPSLIAEAQTIALESTMETALAVWHHSIAGGPRERDYLDASVVHRFIDSGYVIGFHGHQHRPEAAPYELHLPNASGMCIVSAGSLCVGDSELPAGELRQFNLVVLDRVDKTVTVHVRGMTAAGVFDELRRMDFGGESWATLTLPDALTRQTGPKPSTLIDDAIDMLRSGDARSALELLDRAEQLGADSTVARVVRIEALEEAGEVAALVGLLRGSERLNARELVLLVDLLLDRGSFDEAVEAVQGRREVEPVLTRDLLSRIESRRMLGG